MTATTATPLGAAALERASAGERLTREEIVALYGVPADEVIAAAHQIRLQKVDSALATFSLGGNVDYTTICNIACKFCTFYRTPHQEGAYTLTIEQIIDQLCSQMQLGITEVMIEGGVNPDLPFEWYVDVLRAIKDACPDVHVDFLSPEEIRGIEKITGRDATDILAELQEAGMDGLPGASAEILVDDVRRRVSPARMSSADWLRIVDAAMQLGIYIPWTGLVFGLGETLEQRAEHLIALRDLQDHDLERGGGGLGAYKVWPMRLADTRLRDVIASPGDEAVIDEYLQQVAIHRLALDNVTNHRSVWRTMGYETAARALRAGANDLCGTGSINAVTSVLETAGREAAKPSQQVLHGVLTCIADAGFIPAQRDAHYNVIEVHSLDEPRSAAHGHNRAGGLAASPSGVHCDDSHQPSSTERS